MAINTSNFSFQGIGIITGINVEGCTDSDALNYDPDATIENGSCVDPVLGCMDPFADNFDASANTDDGSCDYSSSQVLGCDDVTACNYNPLANTNDGSCILPDGCTDPTATNYDASAVCDDSSCTYLVVVNGCTDPTANNYDASANTDDGSCTYTVSGCTDPVATCNYDATATIDDGSCIYPGGCNDSSYVEYDASVTCPDNLNDCITISVLGCMDCGTYWEDLNNVFCDGVSSASTLGSINYNPAATVDDGSCTLVIYGCTDPNACDFDDTATVSDGSCTTYPPSNADCDGNCLPGFISVNNVCVAEVFGCMDDAYIEYDETANVDDGSCTTLIVLGCTDNGLNINGGGVVNDINGDGLPALNYNALANVDDGSCTSEILGCTDPGAANYDDTATQDDGSCDLSNLKIGDFYQGGFIFYFNNSIDGNDGGLIMANYPGVVDYNASGQSPYGACGPASFKNWDGPDTGNDCINVVIGTGNNIGDGALNKQAFINNGCATNTTQFNLSAMGTAVNANNYGYYDWFLPSRDELEEAMKTIGPAQTDATLVNSLGHTIQNIVGIASYTSTANSPNTTQPSISYVLYSSSEFVSSPSDRAYCASVNAGNYSLVVHPKNQDAVQIYYRLVREF